MSTLAAVLAVLVSAAVAGLAATLTVERRERRARAAALAEELYALVESFDQTLAAYFVRSRAIIAEGRSSAPLEEAGWLDMRRDSARARALIGLHFPTLWPLVKRTDAMVSQAVASLQRHERDCRDPGLARGLDRSLGELKDAMEALKRAVVAAHHGGESRRPILPRRWLPRLHGLRAAV